MASELAGFGRNFRAGMHSMVGKNLAFKILEPLETFSSRRVRCHLHPPCPTFGKG